MPLEGMMIKELCKRLETDEGLYLSYQANIAMSFKDECSRYKKKSGKNYLSYKDIHEIANKASQNFLNLLIKH